MFSFHGGMKYRYGNILYSFLVIRVWRRIPIILLKHAKQVSTSSLHEEAHYKLIYLLRSYADILMDCRKLSCITASPYRDTAVSVIYSTGVVTDLSNDFQFEASSFKFLSPI